MEEIEHTFHIIMARSNAAAPQWALQLVLPNSTKNVQVTYGDANAFTFNKEGLLRALRDSVGFCVLLFRRNPSILLCFFEFLAARPMRAWTENTALSQSCVPCNRAL